jgi:hypothetical protein
MNPRERLRAGEQAAREHRYEEALDHYIWFHEHALEHAESYYGVRLSFALASWAELGESYPRALDVLKDIRDHKTERLLAGSGNRDLFNDVEAINQYLQEEERTYWLFRELHTRFPDLAKSCADIAMPALVNNKDYKLARLFIEQPEEMVHGWSNHLNQEIDDLKRKPATRAPVKDAYVRIYIDRVREILQVLAGTGEQVRASKLRLLATQTLSDADAHTTVETALANLPLVSPAA